VIIVIVVVALLAVLVAGLLRSHADILAALHNLGAGVGDPALGPDVPVTSGPLTIGPPLPGERTSSSAPDIVGVTPEGDAVAVSMVGGDHLTLVAFLSTGCASCAEFWQSLRRPDRSGLPDEIRLAVVTRGPEFESPAEVAAKASGELSVIMSSSAWTDYEVPGSPFFALVSGREGRRIGEGVANHFVQVAELVRRAQADAGHAGGRPLVSIDGTARELDNDLELRRAGILPGDPSLYPSTLEDIYGPATPSGPDAGDR
jgi:hypothetical protein